MSVQCKVQVNTVKLLSKGGSHGRLAGSPTPGPPLVQVLPLGGGGPHGQLGWVVVSGRVRAVNSFLVPVVQEMGEYKKALGPEGFLQGKERHAW